jgi:pantoate--beta-alanine ligase
VSIFVNPTQFDDPKDFARYPKTLDSDAVICEAAGASIVYAPSVEDVYPPGEVLSPAPIPPQATTPRLEDGQRRGHFEGVCTVVKRLFELVRPSVAYFGEKDWQQLQVIAAMTKLAGLGVTIAPVETVRDPDGLAMSSRNGFLSPEDRVRGLSLSRALRACQRASTPLEAEAIMRAELEASQVVADYAVVRDAAGGDAEAARADGHDGLRAQHGLDHHAAKRRRRAEARRPAQAAVHGLHFGQFGGGEIGEGFAHRLVLLVEHR